MNLATQRPVKHITPDPVYGVMWYACQHDCWGAQHGCVITQYLGDDGRYYQMVDYMDPEPWDNPSNLVLHGPAPKSWIDASDFGCVIPDFC